MNYFALPRDPREEGKEGANKNKRVLKNNRKEAEKVKRTTASQSLGREKTQLNIENDFGSIEGLGFVNQDRVLDNEVDAFFL